MREILFRGKRHGSGDWIYGFLTLWDLRRPAIFVPTEKEKLEYSDPFGVTYCVDPATVGQYTGLKDKNGVKIFEGDILHYSYDYPGSIWLKAEGKTDADIRYYTGDVFWQEWRGTWAVGARVNRHSANQDIFVYCRNPNRVEVIGNIHDNPELVERESNGS